MSAPAIAVEDVVRDFPAGRRTLRALDGVSLAVADGETLGIVGESGCGKSTLVRIMLRLLAPTSGTVRLLGEEIGSMSEAELRPRRRVMQAVFQDPMSSLNPRLTVHDIVAEPLRGLSRTARKARVDEVLHLVGLPRDAAGRYPHAFSGGQRQRIAIARALAGQPRVMICDEATSALDLSVQAQILNLLADLQATLRLTVVFVSHNLAAVRHVSNRVAVMYLGRIVEIGPEADIFDRPQHPYTQALLAAVPEVSLDPASPPPLAGEVPSPLDRPTGCHFHPRCPRAAPRCAAETPALLPATDGGHAVRCFYPG
jgi:peptide/nickel transport system ATP-binding protein